MIDLDVKLNTLLVALSESLLRHVMPVFSMPLGKRPALVGTALLVGHRGHSYLVSARHVVDFVRTPGTLYHYVAPGKLARLFGNVLHTVPMPGSDAHDNYDVAVVRLLDESRPPYPSLGKVEIPSSLLRPLALPRDAKEYMVTGFPRSRSRANPSNKRLLSEPSAFRVVSAKPDQYNSLRLLPSTHLVMPLDVGNMRFPDGSSRRIPDPHGMSGSPVWLNYDSAGQNDPSFTNVVGIAIEYHKDKKLLVATDIGVALELLERDAA